MPVTKSKQGKPLGGIGAERQSRRKHSLVLDDRLLSKQYITNKLDDRIDNTAFDSNWSNDTSTAPSKAAIFNKINSMGLYTHEWTHESTASDSKVKTAHTGFYGIGDLDYDDITHKLTVDGDVKMSGLKTVGDNFSVAKTNVGASSTVMARLDTSGWRLYQRMSVGYLSETNMVSLLRLTPPEGENFANATLANNTHGLEIGPTSGAAGADVLGLGSGSIQAKGGSSATVLRLNNLGGQVQIGTAGSGGETYIKGDSELQGDVTISGNLTVSGTATSLDTQQITAEDPFILINSLGTAQNAGIEVERTGLDNVSLRWNNTGATTGQWEFTNDGSTFTAIGSGGGGSGTITSFTNGVDNRIVTASGTATLNGEATLTFDGTDLTHTTTSTAGGFTLAGTNGSSGNTVLDITGGDSSSSNAAVSIEGHLEATTKSFNIPHPLLDNKRLVYGSLEGPEHGMYQRGSFDIEDERRIVAIDLPVYWSAMTYEDYTVNLTTYGDYNVWISNRDENGFWVETNAEKEWSFDWSVIAGRKDAKLVVEPDA